MRTASAGRGLVRGSPVTINSTGVSSHQLKLTKRSVAAIKSLKQAQAGKYGIVIDRKVAALRAVGAGDKA